jgi:hypothetical protein
MNINKTTNRKRNKNQCWKREKKIPGLKNIIITRIHLPRHLNSYQATGNEANPHHPGQFKNLDFKQETRC